MDLFTKMYDTVLQIVTSLEHWKNVTVTPTLKKHSRKPQKQQLSIQIQLKDKMNKKFISYGDRAKTVWSPQIMYLTY